MHGRVGSLNLSVAADCLQWALIAMFSKLVGNTADP